MISITARMLIACSLLILMNAGFAETQKTINYGNQREESFDLENFLKETRTRTEQVDSTCYHQIPYTENVCRNETRYREECRTIPGHQECSTVYDPICHTETRYENECHSEQDEPICRVVIHYREECSRRGGGRQCHTVPPDIQCHRDRNGENKCDKIPAHEECSDSPGQQECHQAPYEERECSSRSSHQVCRQVPREQQICENRARQQCDWVPDRRACENIPYQVPVCKDEVLYRQEPYACKKTVDVPYEVTLKTHKANVQVNFAENAASVTPEFNISLSTDGVMSISGKDAGDTKAAAFVKKVVKNNEQAGVNSITAHYNIALFDRTSLFGFMDKGLSHLDLKKTSLTFYVTGKFDARRASLSVHIAKKDKVKFDKILNSNQFESVFDGIGTSVSVDLEKLGSPKLGGVFNREHQVTLKLKLDYSDVGEILLPERKELSATLNQAISVD
ncbi:MAG: hypothetical protein PHY93_20290 [Bacteriovorax sp.]|nr:hypothetical protein [Bacteriovorax sp.]